MLTGSFFELASIDDVAGKLTAVIQFNNAHPIFEGHFPGQPVVPGVCMMQIVKEILQDQLGVTARLEVADQVKFLTVINPLVTGRVNIELSYSGIEMGKVKISATFFNSDTIFFKMRGVFGVTAREQILNSTV